MKKNKRKLKEPVALTMVGLDRARRELSRLVRETQRTNTRFLLSERGKPQAVVLSIDDYLRNILRRERLSVIAEIQLEAKDKGLMGMSMEGIDREISTYRKEKSQSQTK